MVKFMIGEITYEKMSWHLAGEKEFVPVIEKVLIALMRWLSDHDLLAPDTQGNYTAIPSHFTLCDLDLNETGIALMNKYYQKWMRSDEPWEEPISFEILEKGLKRVKKTRKQAKSASTKPSRRLLDLAERDNKNFMAPGQLLDEIRELYLDRYAEAIAKCRRKKSVKVFAEVALTTSDGEPIGEGPLNLPLRIDIAIVKKGIVKESFRVDSELRLYFETFSLDWAEKLPVTLSPFQWDFCQARLFGLPDSPDWKPLVDWFMSSFHESSPSGAEEDFSGVVHFMSDPQLQGECYLVEFDFGSAPVETFGTLLDAFASVGAKAVEIGQFEDVQEVAAVET